jgi:putative Mn2+ efflux pump MntP
MQSIESKNWLTALIIGIIGLFLAACGIVIAYKQLKRTKNRADDLGASNALRDAAVPAHETEGAR